LRSWIPGIKMPQSREGACSRSAPFNPEGERACERRPVRGALEIYPANPARAATIPPSVAIMRATFGLPSQS
jgi:hypothetical protein